MGESPEAGTFSSEAQRRVQNSGLHFLGWCFNSWDATNNMLCSISPSPSSHHVPKVLLLLSNSCLTLFAIESDSASRVIGGKKVLVEISQI